LVVEGLRRVCGGGLRWTAEVKLENVLELQWKLCAGDRGLHAPIVRVRSYRARIAGGYFSLEC
jgi:hypothetical protein